MMQQKADETKQKSGFSRFLLSAMVILVIAGTIMILAAPKSWVGVVGGVLAVIAVVLGFWWAVRELPRRWVDL